MKRHHFGLAAGAVLLVAAQDVPTPPAQDATFSEAFTEQSDAAEAVQTAQALDEPTAEPTVPAAETPAPPSETAVSPTEPGAASPKAAEPAGEAARPSETAVSPMEPGAASPKAAEPAGEAAPPSETAVSPTELGAASPKAAEPAGEAAPAAAAIPAKGEPPTREFMVGIWAEPGEQCEAAMDFKADGTLIGPFPRWELTDGVLTMVGNRQKIWLTVIDQDTMQSRRSETDPPRTLKRCPKAPTPPQP